MATMASSKCTDLDAFKVLAGEQISDFDFGGT